MADDTRKNTNDLEDGTLNEDTTVNIPNDVDAPSDELADDLQVVVDEQSNTQRRMRNTLAVVAIVLIILLLLGCLLLNALLGENERAAIDTGGITWIRSIYAYGPNPDQLISPASASFQPGSSDLWTSDPSSHRIIRFDWFGNTKEALYRDVDDSIFKFPGRVAIASNGDIWVVKTTYSRVYAYDSNLNLLTSMHVPRPHSIAVNDNRVIVGATGGIVAFERDGTLIGWMGERGREDGMFDTINGVYLEANNDFYVVDTFNARLSKYNGEFDREWIVGLGTPISAGSDEETLGQAGRQTEEFPAGMQMPMGITKDAAGRLIVIDNLDFSIAAFNANDGSFIDKWGAFGQDHGQLMNASDISYDPITDSFLIADNGNGRLQIISLPGSGGSAVGSQVGRLLNGPLAACLIPLLLLILFAILMTIWNFLKKRREKALLEDEKATMLEEAEDILLEDKQTDQQVQEVHE
ncbi:MAG: NHL repeat-containing protein [Coriobacteriia bacterium]|nr:NHL repeat-containing protein [Coriobacteriia bacterium]